MSYSGADNVLAKLRGKGLKESFVGQLRESVDLETAKGLILNFVDWSKLDGETWERLHPQFVSLVKELTTNDGISVDDLAPAINKAREAINKLGLPDNLKV